MRKYFIALILIVSFCSNEKFFAQEAAREKLLTLFAGEWVSRSLHVVTKLEIADHLESGPQSVERLAQLTASNEDSLYRLLHMLAGFGVFEEVSSKVFANTEVSQLLVKTNRDTLHSLSLFYGEDIHKSWEEILASIQTGVPAFQLNFKEPVFTYFKNNPERAALFQAAMKEKSKAVIQSALSTYNFGQFESICDVGGGYGQFMQALLAACPRVLGTVFELPEVVEKIKPLENNRLELFAGDFFNSIPKGKDAYLLKSVIHDWDNEEAEKILKNCRSAMRDDSRLLIVEVLLQPGSQSVYANCMDVLMLAITGGKERTLASFTQMLENCGFVIERIYPTSTEFSILEVKKVKL